MAIRRKRGSGNAAESLRPLLTGDAPLDEFLRSVSDFTTEPWLSLKAASDALTVGNARGAEVELRGLLSTELEPRIALEVWAALRALGVHADAAETGRVLGVVVDLPIARGHDTLAAYADGTARYLNHSGSVIVLDTGAPDLLKMAKINVELAQQMVDVRGLGNGTPVAFPPLARGSARISLLTPGGVRGGQGPIERLQAEPDAGEIIKATMLTISWLIKATS